MGEAHKEQDFSHTSFMHRTGPGPHAASPGDPGGLAVAKRPLLPPTDPAPRGCCPVPHIGSFGRQGLLESEPLRLGRGAGLPEVSWGPSRAAETAVPGGTWRRCPLGDVRPAAPGLQHVPSQSRQSREQSVLRIPAR